MGQISDITRQTNVGTQEAAASVSYLAELTEQLRSSVSTFRLPERSNDGMGAFPAMTSVTELQGGNVNQFFPPALGPGADNDWARDFSGNFSPLPEPGNSGSLVTLSARNGQFSNNQQNFNQPSFGQSQGFGGQPSFTDQPSFGGQQGFSAQPSFNNQQSFSGQPTANQYQQGFGGQQPFDNQTGFDEFAGFEHQQSFGDQQQFGNMQNFAGQGQSNFPAPNQGIDPQRPNSGSFYNNQAPGQPGPQASRQQWQKGSQQNQSQSQFGQDQAPFPNNGQNGQ
jgi:hypothetical protein